jgi:two-component system nitrate/nitrite response regulator NarL
LRTMTVSSWRTPPRRRASWPEGRTTRCSLDPAPARRFEASWLREARERTPQARLIIHTTEFDPASLLPALQAHIAGYLFKGVPSGEALTDVAYLVSRSSVVVVDESIRDFFEGQPERLRLAPAVPPPQALSPRERQVLEMAAHGLYDEEIARRLGTAANTVHNQVRSAMDKLGARSREHAIFLAVRYGIVDPYA